MEALFLYARELYNSALLSYAMSISLFCKLYACVRCCSHTKILYIPYILARNESIGANPCGTPCAPLHKVWRLLVVITKDDAPTDVYGETDASVTDMALLFQISSIRF